MTTPRIAVLVAGCLLAAGAAAQGKDPERGRLLYENHCLECHTNTPMFHDLSKIEFRNCTVCHSRIHGSNVNRYFLE